MKSIAIISLLLLVGLNGFGQDISPPRSRVKVALVFIKKNTGKYWITNDAGYTFLKVKKSKKEQYYYFYYELPMNVKDNYFMDIIILKKNLRGRYKGNDIPTYYKRNKGIFDNRSRQKRQTE